MTGRIWSMPADALTASHNYCFRCLRGVCALRLQGQILPDIEYQGTLIRALNRPALALTTDFHVDVLNGNLLTTSEEVFSDNLPHRPADQQD
jgi:hypothetical protein